MLWILIIIILLFLPPIIFSKRKSKHIIVQGPLMLLKMKKGKGFLKKMAKRKKFFQVFTQVATLSSFGIFSLKYVENKKLSYVIYLALLIPLIFSLPFDFFICSMFGLGGYALYLLSLQTLSIIQKLCTGQTPLPGIVPIIPGISIPGIGTVPWEVIFSLAVIVFFHELSHGIIAVLRKVKVKSLGIAFFGAIPIGAFTEIDDKSLNRADAFTKIKIFSAGSYANYIIALIFFSLLYLLSPPISSLQTSIFLTHVDTIHVLGVAKGSLAEQLNLTNTTIYNPQVLLSQNETILLKTSKGEFYIPKATLGIVKYNYTLKSPLPLSFFFLSSLQKFLLWTAYLNFVVALVNLLPLPIFDGGRISHIIFGRRGHKVLESITVALFIINAFPLVFYLLS